MTTLMGREGAAGGLRAGLLLLVVLGVAGTALALAYERHWQSAWQLAPWITLGIISAGALALVVRPEGATVWLARTVAVLAIVSGALGVWQHFDGNYSSRTDGVRFFARPSFGDVVTGAAGRTPVPAALSVVPVGLALGLATIGLGGARRPSQE